MRKVKTGRAGPSVSSSGVISTASKHVGLGGHGGQASGEAMREAGVGVCAAAGLKVGTTSISLRTIP